MRPRHLAGGSPRRWPPRRAARSGRPAPPSSSSPSGRGRPTIQSASWGPRRGRRGAWPPRASGAPRRPWRRAAPGRAAARPPAPGGRRSAPPAPARGACPARACRTGSRSWPSRGWRSRSPPARRRRSESTAPTQGQGVASIRRPRGSRSSASRICGSRRKPVYLPSAATPVASAGGEQPGRPLVLQRADREVEGGDPAGHQRAVGRDDGLAQREERGDEHHRRARPARPGCRGAAARPGRRRGRRPPTRRPPPAAPSAPSRRGGA